MNWGAIGAVGEILGAIAVFLTLVYLAIQIRQNNNAVRITAVDSGISAVNVVREKLVEDPDVAEIFIRGGKDPESLNETDALRYRVLITNMMWTLWNLYSQTKYANLPDNVWECQIPVIKRILNTNGGRSFWQAHGDEFEKSFVNEINRIVSTRESE